MIVRVNEMKKRSILAALILLALSVSLLGGCGGAQKGEGTLEGDGGDGKLTVAVSIVPEATFVQKICGDRAEVITMIPAGYSPETYEPTPQEIAAFQEADVYFSIGVNTEDTYIMPMVSQLTQVVKLNEICADSYGELELDGGRDPHIWLSPKRAILMVQTIAETLAETDPDNAAEYETNANEYIGELQACNTDINEMFEMTANRGFIVFHPAFGYFADEYGLTQYALEEGGKEATAAHMKEMADLAETNGIKVIFYQAQTDSSQAEAFAEEIGGRAVMLDPLSADYIPNLVSMARNIAEVLE